MSHFEIPLEVTDFDGLYEGRDAYIEFLDSLDDRFILANGVLSYFTYDICQKDHDGFVVFRISKYKQKNTKPTIVTFRESLPAKFTKNSPGIWTTGGNFSNIVNRLSTYTPGYPSKKSEAIKLANGASMYVDSIKSSGSLRMFPRCFNRQNFKNFKIGDTVVCPLLVRGAYSGNTRDVFNSYARPLLTEDGKAVSACESNVKILSLNYRTNYAKVKSEGGEAFIIHMGFLCNPHEIIPYL